MKALAKQLYEHLKTVPNEPLPGNTVQDVADTLEVSPNQLDLAIRELADAGLARSGRLWTRIGDQRIIVALGRARFGEVSR